MNIKQIQKKWINRETILYTFFGFMTFILAMIVFQGLIYLGIDYKISNIFSLIIGKLFAYLMNKLVVFKCRNNKFIDFIKEFTRFVLARGLTALIDYFGVIFVVEILNWDKIVGKYFFMTLVIILNYFFGKKIVFKKGQTID